MHIYFVLIDSLDKPELQYNATQALYLPPTLTVCLPDVLHELVVAGEGLETLLTLVGLHLGSTDTLATQLHGGLRHQVLQTGQHVIQPGVSAMLP